MDQENQKDNMKIIENDKLWVIVCTTGIAIVAMVFLADPSQIVSNIQDYLE